MAFNSTNIGRPAGAGFTGEKLVGNLDFFTVEVLTDIAEGGMPFASTGVVASRSELVEAGELSDPVLSATNTVTILHPAGAFADRDTGSTVYTANAAYDLAFAQQKNYDLMIEAIAQKAQPVLMSLVVDSVGSSDDFLGGGAGSTDEIATFRFAVEHTAVYSDNPVATDPKAEGVAELLDGVGDSLRVVASSDDNPFGGGGTFDTWNSDVGGSVDNFIVTFAGTL